MLYSKIDRKICIDGKYYPALIMPVNISIVDGEPVIKKVSLKSSVNFEIVYDNDGFILEICQVNTEKDIFIK